MAKKDKKKSAPKKQMKKKETSKYKKKRVRRVVLDGRAYINATYNNTIVTLTENNGNILGWSSAGANGFRGPKKGTPYAAQIAAGRAVESGKAYGLEKVDVFVKGVGSGREQAIRGLQSSGLQVKSIKDITPIQHGGCRRKKPRRV